jgi:uncharacterized RDD family membrane protein YckC
MLQSDAPRPPNPPTPGIVDDAYDLRTPEQIELQYDLAGLGSRFMAIALDSLIQGAVMLALFSVFGFGMALLSVSMRDMLGRNASVFAIGGIALVVLLIFLLSWGYFIFFEMVWNGQTPGKRITGIRVLTVRGEPVTLVHSLVRNLLRLVDSLPSGYMLGIIVMLATARSQRLGDLAAGTIVVRERHAELPRALPPLDPSLMLPPHLASAFASRDVLLARDFMRRAPSLSPDRRAVLGRQIAATLRARLTAAGYPAPPDFADEHLLAAVAALRA